MTQTAGTQVYNDTYAADRAEIEDLMARYLFALDYNDIDTFMTMFSEDAEFEFAPGTVKGKAAIREAITSFKRRIGEIYVDEVGNAAVLRHVLTYKAIRVEGDRAWTRAMWFEMADDGPRDAASGRKTPKMGTFGIYADELRKVEGRWLFSKRRVLNEFLPGRESGPENPTLSMDREGHAASGAAR